MAVLPEQLAFPLVAPPPPPRGCEARGVAALVCVIIPRFPATRLCLVPVPTLGPMVIVCVRLKGSPTRWAGEGSDGDECAFVLLVRSRVLMTSVDASLSERFSGDNNSLDDQLTKRRYRVGNESASAKENRLTK